MFVSVDGDDIGREIERCLLSCDVHAAVRLSTAVESALNRLAGRLREQGFKIMFASGDSLLAEGPTLPVSWLAGQLADLGVSFSGGLGESTALAHLALRAAKTHGKGRAAGCVMNVAAGDGRKGLRFELVRITDYVIYE